MSPYYVHAVHVAAAVCGLIVAGEFVDTIVLIAIIYAVQYPQCVRLSSPSGSFYVRTIHLVILLL